MATCTKCGRVIHWRRSQFGNPVPLDDAPADDGRIVMFTDGTCLLTMDREREDFLEQGVALYHSHAETCPFADFIGLTIRRDAEQLELLHDDEPRVWRKEGPDRAA